MRSPLMTWNEHAEEDEDLEDPVFVNGIDESPKPAAHEGGQDVQPHEGDHPQASDAVQDISQHRTFALVPQGIFQADIPFQAHPRLLHMWKRLQSFILNSLKPLQRSCLNKHALLSHP